MKPLVHIEGLVKRHGERLLFDIADWQIAAGTALVLTGVNGAGKSTLLRVLAGLEAADMQAGSFDGRAFTLKPYPDFLRREIVYVHQHPVMFSTSVPANIAYGLAARGVSKTEMHEKVEAAMSWAGVDHLRAADPRRLSGGEKQRIALARARVLQPRLLLLDEPTSNLDGQAREQLIALVPSLVASGGSVIIACHDRDLINLPEVHRIKLRDGGLQLR